MNSDSTTTGTPLIAALLDDHAGNSAFETARNRDFVEGPYLRLDVTKHELRERIWEAQRVIHDESHAMGYCMTRLAELDGTEDDGEMEDDLEEAPWA